MRATYMNITHNLHNQRRNMSKYKMNKVVITTRKGKALHVRKLSPQEIKQKTKYSTFHYEGKDEG